MAETLLDAAKTEEMNPGLLQFALLFGREVAETPRGNNHAVFGHVEGCCCRGDWD
jgi:hypothetical protein